LSNLPPPIVEKIRKSRFGGEKKSGRAVRRPYPHDYWMAIIFFRKKKPKVHGLPNANGVRANGKRTASKNPKHKRKKVVTTLMAH